MENWSVISANDSIKKSVIRNPSNIEPFKAPTSWIRRSNNIIKMHWNASLKLLKAVVGLGTWIWQQQNNNKPHLHAKYSSQGSVLATPTYFLTGKPQTLKGLVFSLWVNLSQPLQPPTPADGYWGESTWFDSPRESHGTNAGRLDSTTTRIRDQFDSSVTNRVWVNLPQPVVIISFNPF